MRTLFYILGILFLLTSCSKENKKITIDNLTSRSMHATSSPPVTKVSFVDGCITVLSSTKVSNIVLETEKGEIILEDVEKSTGLFCSPNGSPIKAATIHTIKRNGDEFAKKFDNANI